jgi:hypothetical protein
MAFTRNILCFYYSLNPNCSPLATTLSFKLLSIFHSNTFRIPSTYITLCIRGEAMDETHDLEIFFERFSKVYARLDVDGVTDMFCLPFFTLINGEKTNWPKLEELYHTTCILFDWYKQQGFYNAQYTVVSLLKLDKNLATARLRWRVTLKDGSPWEYCTSYQLKRIYGEWAMAGVIQYEEKISPMQPNHRPLKHPLARAEDALRHLVDLPKSEEIQLLPCESADDWIG